MLLFWCPNISPCVACRCKNISLQDSVCRHSVSVCTYSFFFSSCCLIHECLQALLLDDCCKKKRRRPSNTSKSWVLLLFACLLKIAQHLTRVSLQSMLLRRIVTTVKNVQRNDYRCWHALLLCALFFMCRRPA